MVNPEIINERLREIDKNIALLEELKAIPFNKFLNDLKTVKCAERCLEISIQCILDISHHIVVENDWPRPKNNKEIILMLGQKGVIPVDFARHILPMAGLRNILIHEYIKVDPKQIYQHLQKLRDFRKFQKHIVIYLKSA